MTVNKMKSEEVGRAEKRKNAMEISKLEGMEKIDYDIKVLGGRIFNVESDVKKFGNNAIFQNKIKIMKDQIKKLQEEKEKYNFIEMKGGIIENEDSSDN